MIVFSLHQASMSVWNTETLRRRVGIENVPVLGRQPIHMLYLVRLQASSCTKVYKTSTIPENPTFSLAVGIMKCCPSPTCCCTSSQPALRNRKAFSLTNEKAEFFCFWNISGTKKNGNSHGVETKHTLIKVRLF